jgi:hypothetical protein
MPCFNRIYVFMCWGYRFAFFYEFDIWFWNFSDNVLLFFLSLRSPKAEGVYCFTSVRLSVRLSFRPSFRPSKIFFVTFFSVTFDGRNLIFGHKLHIGTPYRGKRSWTHQIPTSCLLTLLIFIHIEHICSFFVTFFSATIDGKNLIFDHKLHIDSPYRGKRFWTHQIPTSCLPILLIFIHN